MTQDTNKGRRFRLTGQRTVFRAVCFYDAAVLVPSVVGVTEDGNEQTAVRLEDIKWLRDSPRTQAVKSERHVTTMSYEEAKAHRYALEHTRTCALTELKSYDKLKGPNGLIPDSVKERPDWQRANDAYWAAHDALGKFNEVFKERFAKEFRAERRTKRTEA